MLMHNYTAGEKLYLLYTYNETHYCVISWEDETKYFFKRIGIYGK
jgi:hypothetical protein